MELQTQPPPQTLTDLADCCIGAGAQGFVIIDSRDDVVVFYRSLEGLGSFQHDAFDELHIQPGRKARILIAIFTEEI